MKRRTRPYQARHARLGGGKIKGLDFILDKFGERADMGLVNQEFRSQDFKIGFGRVATS